VLRTLILTAIVSFLSINSSYARDWERLGERRVGFIGDHDTIEVGRREGRFRRLKLIVRKNDIELNSIHVLFGNGEVEKIRFEQRVRDGGEAVVNLTSPWREGRFIRAVEIHYHSKPNFRGEAIAELWAQQD
jgi:hypothetical protein